MQEPDVSSKGNSGHASPEILNRVTDQVPPMMSEAGAKLAEHTGDVGLKNEDKK